MSYYVYRHKHPITKDVFYIGKGTGDRAYDTCNRSVEWLSKRNEIIASCGVDREVEIVHCFEEEEKALELESVEIYRAKLIGFDLVNKVKLKSIDIKVITDRIDNLQIGDDYIRKDDSIGKIVKSKRTTLNLTQAELADHSKTGRTFIIDLENGKETCQMDKVEQVLKVFGLTISAVECKNTRPI